MAVLRNKMVDFEKQNGGLLKNKMVEF